MTPIRALVTGTNSTVGQSILKALRGASLEVEIFGCDVNPYSPGLYRADRAFLVRPYTDPAYEAQMLTLLNTHRIDALFPAVEGELQSLAERRPTWEAETGARILVNPKAVVDIAQDKFQTARFLASHGCRVPESTVETGRAALEAFVESVGFPVVLKPRRGATSRHVHVVENWDALWARLATVPGPVVQAYLPGEEYTCGVFVDAHGELKGIATLRRMLANGITGVAIVEPDRAVEAEVARVVRALQPRGAVNVQLRRDRDGRPTTFEVNARFSSSVAIRAHFGFNEAEASLRSFLLGEAVPAMACRPGVAMRYVNEVYAEPEAVATLLAEGSLRPRGVIEEHF